MERPTITFTGPSAIALIRAARIGGGVRLRQTDLRAIPPVGEWTPSAPALQDLLPVALAPDVDHHPLFVVAPRPEDRARRHGFAWSVDRRTLPEGTLLEVAGIDGQFAAHQLPRDLRIFVTSPEESVATLAGMLCAADQHVGHASYSHRTFARLAALSLELCGTYGRTPLTPGDSECVYKLGPVTSVDALAWHCSNPCLGDRDGLRLVRRVAGDLADGLRSPLEAAAYLSLKLTPRRGGLSFPAFLSNGELDVPESLRSQGYPDVIHPDFWWPDLHVALETEGFATHGTREGRAQDNKRLRIYQAKGITVFPALYDEVCTVAGMDSVLSMVAEKLSERSVGTSLQKRFKRTFADERGRALRGEMLEVVLPPAGRQLARRAD